MTGARFVHDTLEGLGWDVLIADAEKVKPFGLGRLQDRQGRLPGPRPPQPARPDPRDLAARPPGPRRARADSLPDAPRRELDDLVIELGTTGPGDHDVGLLLHPMP